MRLTPEVVALGISQIIGYGTLYYSFGVLAPQMSRDFGWSLEWVFGALSAALLVSGFVSPVAGRWIDRLGAGRIMTMGSLAAAASLVACAMAPSGMAFAPALTAMEAASTLVQYGAAFSLLVQRTPATAQRDIVYLTLFAGFASTIFWPLTAWLNGFFDWRRIYVGYAAMHVLVCLPLHAWLARRPPRPQEARPEAPAAGGPAASRSGDLAPEDRRAGFVLMTVAFALVSFILSAILMHMMPMLDTLGLGAVAVAVSASFGPSQVISRILNIMFARDMAQTHLSTIAAAALALGLVVLACTAPSFYGAVAFAAVFGVGSGLFSIVSGTLPLELLGRDGYGALQGRLMSARLIVGAAAPFAFAWMMQQLGAIAALLVTSLTGVVAVGCLVQTARLRARGRRGA
ncbi:arsenite efflux MFS transporter ArsK [Camelimonas abortus]|uniref:Arsenite efflux MFS transporter ArsK n=1 Tax=Camelimonas abortus TaxID=1017184 RepID=A0ABV7LCI3_9HYPH